MDGEEGGIRSTITRKLNILWVHESRNETWQRFVMWWHERTFSAVHCTERQNKRRLENPSSQSSIDLWRMNLFHKNHSSFLLYLYRATCEHVPDDFFISLKRGAMWFKALWIDGWNGGKYHSIAVESTRSKTKSRWNYSWTLLLVALTTFDDLCITWKLLRVNMLLPVSLLRSTKECPRKNCELIRTFHLHLQIREIIASSTYWGSNRGVRHRLLIPERLRPSWSASHCFLWKMVPSTWNRLRKSE
jgi:hypothetical protein